MISSAVELLAPAKNREYGLAAINCGADAVYIGAERFGARENAGNSLQDIAALAEYAHLYRARVYVTLNTLLFDAEMEQAVKMAHELYEAGADGLIIQDMGLLECDLPPIPLMASTQMHNDSLEKVQFLHSAGFKRVILARELALAEIRHIRENSTIELETFIHGALCVSYSGQCYMSYALGGRSANRGRCAQPCRQRYSLLSLDGKVLVKDRYLLSLKDLNLSAYLGELLQAGVNSFKIEGRLKDLCYVKNIVLHYRLLLDDLLDKNGLAKSSYGEVFSNFTPDPARTFNRGYTSYFLRGRKEKIASWDTSKSLGEKIGAIEMVGEDFITVKSDIALHNGDGICFFNKSGELCGTFINSVNGPKLYPDKMRELQSGIVIYRNQDRYFEVKLLENAVVRRIPVSLRFSECPEGFTLLASDREGNAVSDTLTCSKTRADNEEQAWSNVQRQLGKLGDTIFSCNEVHIDWRQAYFLPLSQINQLRRNVLDKLYAARLAQYVRPVCVFHKTSHSYPGNNLNWQGNVLNKKAEAFYHRHGVAEIERTAESCLNLRRQRVMMTKYCIRAQMGACHSPEENIPLEMRDEAGHVFLLKFDCKKCRMEIFWQE